MRMLFHALLPTTVMEYDCPKSAIPLRKNMRFSAPRMAEMRNFGGEELRVFNCWLQFFGDSANFELTT